MIEKDEIYVQGIRKLSFEAVIEGEVWLFEMNPEPQRSSSNIEIVTEWNHSLFDPTALFSRTRQLNFNISGVAFPDKAGVVYRVTRQPHHPEQPEQQELEQKP